MVFTRLPFPQENIEVYISYLGYKTTTETIDLTKKNTKNFYLFEDAENLDEIIIESNIEKTNIKTAQMSVNKLSTKTIKQIPVVLGRSRHYKIDYPIAWCNKCGKELLALM